MTFCMFPIFSAMLTKYVHDTKTDLARKLASLEQDEIEARKKLTW